jgi:hypothetical protein
VSSVDLKRLKEIVNSSAVGKEVVRELANRRPQPKTDLDRLRRTLEENTGLAISRSKFTDLFQLFEKAGAGSIILGQGTTPHRFEWRYSIKEICARLLGDESSPRNDSTHSTNNHSPVMNGSKGTHSGGSAEQASYVKTSYPLPKGRAAHITIPKNLTRGEAAEIADFVKHMGRE